MATHGLIQINWIDVSVSVADMISVDSNPTQHLQRGSCVATGERGMVNTRIDCQNQHLEYPKNSSAKRVINTLQCSGAAPCRSSSFLLYVSTEGVGLDPAS